MISFCHVQNRRRIYYKDSSFLILVGKNIRKYRKAKNITLQDLAFLCNDIDYAYINKIELGQVNLSVSYLKLIADTLGVTISDLTT